MYRNNFWRFFAKIWPKKITSRDGCVLLILGLGGQVPILFYGRGDFSEHTLGGRLDYICNSKTNKSVSVSVSVIFLGN